MVINRVILSIMMLLGAIHFVKADGYQEKFFSVDENSTHVQIVQQISAPAGNEQMGNSSAGVIGSRTEQNINRGGAVLRSLVMPGWGESYLGYHGTARLFFWTDMAIWAGVIGLETYSIWKEDQFIAYASTHAGAQMGGKNDSFYADIGNYDNTEAYNEAKLRDRNYEALYTSSSYYWAWDSRENRSKYDGIRISSKSAHNNMYFFLGAAALNRLISFVDTGKKARDVMREQRKPKLGFHVQPDYIEGSSSVQLVISAEL